jgi:trk system potassium uptake protein
LRVAGVPWFECICYTFSCISTGGLAPHNASIGFYDSIAVDMIIIVFMVAAGVNFGLYYQAIRGKVRTIWKDTELRVYLALKVLAIILVAVTIFGLPIVTTTGQIVDGTAGQTARYSAFSIIAMHTGTGFATADFNLWPYFAKMITIGLMFIGGCGGSTAGGIKVIRFWIGLKIIVAELERAFRPNVVRPVKVAGAAIDADLKLTTMVFLLSFAVLWGLGAFLLMLIESPARCGPVTACTASLATLANVGPGLGLVGPVENYGWFSAPSKYVMSMLMALGRLEVFTVLVLCTPRFWRGD